MRKLSTELSTGDQIFSKANGFHGKIGVFKDKKIHLHWSISEHSGITEQVSTRKLNQWLKSTMIVKVNPPTNR